MAILLEKQDFSDIYDLLEVSFPHSEFREREAQAALFDKAPYRVYGLREGDKLLALCALWELPGWRYLEHLAVAPEARNGGLGGRFLDGLTEDRPCVLEVELPETDLARRRIGFYKRNGAKEAGYDMTLFGVPYRVLYWAAQEVDPLQIARQHAAVYQNRFARPLYDKYITIPWSPRDGMPDRVDWAKAEEEFE